MSSKTTANKANSIKNPNMQKFLVCCALPYANGPIHLGHLAGAYLPGDIYARFRRMQGHDVHFVCGTDEHGVAITFRALQENTTPQAIVDKYHAIIHESLKKCAIHFDIFSRTTKPCHIKRSQEFFLRLYENGLVEKRAEKRLYCALDKQFLPDRYVVGECPHCHASGARGDQCEKCGTWYEPEQLINPICQICGKTKASLSDTAHWHLRLDKLEPQIRTWLESKTDWRKNVLGYAFQPLKSELTARSITRDLSWGVPVPLPDAKDKVLYVWFDAPLGYISASEDWSEQIGEPEKWRHYWEDKNTKLIHFIGKDNIIFHSVIWPAVLMGDARYVLPDLVAGNEFLNLEGEKFSTSRNYAVWLDQVLDVLPADLLRYYITAISPETSDSNFSWTDYQTKINTELADIIGNLVNRTLTFINKHFEGSVSQALSTFNPELKERVELCYKNYCCSLEQGFSKQALTEIVELARFLNVKLQLLAPWKSIKEDRLKAQNDLNNVVISIKALAILLAPICPSIAAEIWRQLGFSSDISGCELEQALSFTLPDQHLIAKDIRPIVLKVEDDFVAQRLEQLKENS